MTKKDVKRNKEDNENDVVWDNGINNNQNQKSNYDPDWRKRRKFYFIPPVIGLGKG